jgi:sec-independent protein translocase protein TatA
MGAFQPLHWVIVAVVALLFFGGRGKLSGIMGDAAKGIRAFRDGLKEEPAATDKAIASGETTKDETRS